jgi:hypothetical protein
LAEAIVHLLADREQAAAFGRAAREAAEGFTMPRTIQALECVYDGLLAGQTTAP